MVCAKQKVRNIQESAAGRERLRKGITVRDLLLIAALTALRFPLKAVLKPFFKHIIV
ncbi:hypothetical protein L4X63_18055 [Geomonas sp. Red32]|uniref:hypothetical protein n=1 Tax=Geomonas sp. Red32 TaxID=2912856 RepID=UPI00202CE93F|nr:hypothetical protein [Geomonas sp. Red32]MCM0083493.1 hypothetical protein [Geomonas sp. Red32]